MAGIIVTFLIGVAVGIAIGFCLGVVAKVIQDKKEETARREKWAARSDVH